MHSSEEEEESFSECLFSFVHQDEMNSSKRTAEHRHVDRMDEVSVMQSIALPESTASGPDWASDESVAMCPMAQANINFHQELEAMLLSRAVLQEMEMLNRHFILTEESLCHLLITTQQEEARRRDKVKLAESKNRQAAKEYHQLMVAELGERMALYNREAAQRSNFFRLYLLEKRELDIMPAKKRHPVSRGTRKRACDEAALVDFLETMHKMKAVEPEPAHNNLWGHNLWGHMVPKCSTDSKSSTESKNSTESKCSTDGSIGNGDSDYSVLSYSSSASSRTTCITPPNAASQHPTGFVHSPYSFDGPSEVTMMMNVEDRGDSQSDCSAGSSANTGSPPSAPTAGWGEEDHRPSGCPPSQQPPTPPTTFSFAAEHAARPPSHPKEKRYHASSAAAAGGLRFPRQAPAPGQAPVPAHPAGSKEHQQSAAPCSSAPSAPTMLLLSILQQHQNAGVQDRKAFSPASSSRPPPSPSNADANAAKQTPHHNKHRTPAVLTTRTPACGAGPKCAPRYDAPQQQDVPHSVEAPAARPKGRAAKAEDETGDDPKVLPSAPQCTHTKHWKRLRSKRGFAFFVCCHCGTKWRVCSIGVRNQSSVNSSVQPAEPAPH